MTSTLPVPMAAARDSDVALSLSYRFAEKTANAVAKFKHLDLYGEKKIILAGHFLMNATSLPVIRLRPSIPIDNTFLTLFSYYDKSGIK